MSSLFPSPIPPADIKSLFKLYHFPPKPYFMQSFLKTELEISLKNIFLKALYVTL